MIDARFYTLPQTASIADWLSRARAAHAAFAVVLPEAGHDILIDRAAPLANATAGAVAFFDNPRYLKDLETTQAAACLVAPAMAAKLPAGCVALVTPQPYRDFAYLLQTMYPTPQAPQGVDIHPSAVVHQSAQIGDGTVIGALTYIGAGVCIGRDCVIDSGCSITHSLLGDRVRILPGARLGQDGFGHAPSAQGHVKVPQLGRVIVQDDVEIGAGTTIDRGALTDTIIGEGSKLDNLIQVGHNVHIGRLCMLAGLTAIAGSTHIEDGVFIGGQTALAGHLRIGTGARIAGGSAVMHNIPPGETWGGYPARPMKQVFREHTVLAKLAAQQRGKPACA